MAVADTIRVEIIWKMNSIDWAVNVLHYTTGETDPLGDDNVASIASAVVTAFDATSLSNSYANETQMSRVRCRDLRTDGNPVLESAINHAGEDTGNPLPAQTCVVTTLRTTHAARTGRGRIYWPAPAASTSDSNGQLGSTHVSRYGACVNDLMLISAGTLGNLALGVYSRTDNITRTVISNTTNNVFDVQTRRRDLSIV